MHAVAFDTLAYAKDLESRGVDSKHAEAHAESLAKVLEEAGFPTKKDFQSATSNVTHVISSLRIDLDSRFAELRPEMNAKFADVKYEVIKWVFGISFAQAALIISVLKIFH